MYRYQRQQIQARKGDVARADHQRQQEIAEHGGDRRDQEEPDHDHAVHREQLVVGLGADQVAVRRRSARAASARRTAPPTKKNSVIDDHVQDADALVVARRAATSADVQAVARR